MNLLNANVPGGILPVMNVRSYQDLKLLCTSNVLAFDAFNCRFTSSGFVVPKGGEKVEYCLGFCPLYPIQDEVSPFLMHFEHNLTLLQKLSSLEAPTQYFSAWYEMSSIHITLGERTQVSVPERQWTHREWPHGLRVELTCRDSYASQAEELDYGRDFIDWALWPNNTHMYKYLLTVLGERDKDLNFPSLCISLSGSYRALRTG